MGCFDSVWLSCPRCQRKLELSNFYLEEVAKAMPSVAAAIIGDTAQCRCGMKATIKGRVEVWAEWDVEFENNGPNAGSALPKGQEGGCG